MARIENSASNAILEVRSLRVRKGPHRVLDGVNLSLSKGTPFAITGESGSGKTTLLFAIAGLFKLESGSIFVDGKALRDLPLRTRAELMGIVFQDYQIFPHLSVAQNVSLAPKLRGLSNQQADIKRILQRLKIDNLFDRHAHEISGGQKQRVAIARALALHPKLLLLDEPSAALDEKTTGELADLLTDISRETQVVVVSHDIPFLDRFCIRRTEMKRGKLEAAL